MDYPYAIRSSISRCWKELRQILYWWKIDKKFSRTKKATFSIDFPCKDYVDNNCRLEALAYRHGYVVSAKELTANFTRYFFRKV